MLFLVCVTGIGLEEHEGDWWIALLANLGECRGVGAVLSILSAPMPTVPAIRDDAEASSKTEWSFSKTEWWR